jgi:metal-sulfur cluster biosynthetic enzyme
MLRERWSDVVSEAAVMEALTDVTDPCSAANGTDLSVVSMGLIDEILIDDGHVTVEMLLSSPDCLMVGWFEDEIEAAVGQLDGVESVTYEPDQGFEWHSGMLSEEAQEQRRERMRERMAAYDGELTEDGNAEAETG